MKKSASPSHSASASISGKKVDVTLEALLTTSKTDFPALFSSVGLTAPSSATLSALQLAFLRASGLDPNLEVTVFINTATARQLQQAAKEASTVQASLTDLNERLKSSADAALDALSKAQDQVQQQAAKIEQSTKALDTAQAKLQNLHRLQNDAAVPCSAPSGGEASCSLRCTGVEEESEETEEALLENVNENLGRLSTQVEAVGARRQGRPGARKGRAIIITFALPCDRSAVLRSKSELSKAADLRSISIDVVLNAEELQQKNALWPMYMQARQNGQRTFWKGCQLFINGQPVQSFCQPTGFEYMNGPNQPSSFADGSLSSFSNPHFPSHPSYPTSAAPPHHHVHHQTRQFTQSAGGFASPLNPLYQHQQPQPQQQRRLSSNQIPHNYTRPATSVPMRP